MCLGPKPQALRATVLGAEASGIDQRSARPLHRRRPPTSTRAAAGDTAGRRPARSAPVSPMAFRHAAQAQHQPLGVDDAGRRREEGGDTGRFGSGAAACLPSSQARSSDAANSAWRLSASSAGICAAFVATTSFAEAAVLDAMPAQ